MLPPLTTTAALQNVTCNVTWIIPGGSGSTMPHRQCEELFAMFVKVEGSKAGGAAMRLASGYATRKSSHLTHCHDVVILTKSLKRFLKVLTQGCLFNPWPNVFSALRTELNPKSLIMLHLWSWMSSGLMSLSKFENVSSSWTPVPDYWCPSRISGSRKMSQKFWKKDFFFPKCVVFRLLKLYNWSPTPHGHQS